MAPALAPCIVAIVERRLTVRPAIPDSSVLSETSSAAGPGEDPRLASQRWGRLSRLQAPRPPPPHPAPAPPRRGPGGGVLRGREGSPSRRPT